MNGSDRFIRRLQRQRYYGGTITKNASSIDTWYRVAINGIRFDTFWTIFRTVYFERIVPDFRKSDAGAVPLM